MRSPYFNNTIITTSYQVLPVTTHNHVLERESSMLLLTFIYCLHLLLHTGLFGLMDHDAETKVFGWLLLLHYLGHKRWPYDCLVWLSELRHLIFKLQDLIQHRMSWMSFRDEFLIEAQELKVSLPRNCRYALCVLEIFQWGWRGTSCLCHSWPQ